MEIGAYYFPNYHLDSRNEEYHGRGWTEWELMKCLRPRFDGHCPPSPPLWGYEDEADPKVMAKKIDVALAHGLDAFVFDWYWYDGPYLQRALDDGFLQADNCKTIKFALMWANHDWYDRHPIGYSKAYNADLLYGWSSTKENIGTVWDYLIDRYLTQPNYWRVDGKPYFSIYAVNYFIERMGGIEETAEVLADFKKRAIAKGLPGVYLNAVWYDNLESQPFCICSQHLWHTKIGFDSYTSYNSISTTPIWGNAFPEVDFQKAADEYIELAGRAMDSLPAPYFPVATAGWDSTPRCTPSEVFRAGAYPYLPVMSPSPEGFLKELHSLNALLESHPAQPQIMLVNAWNEWTEGSYLEPDTNYGTALLDALLKFKSCRNQGDQHEKQNNTLFHDFCCASFRTGSLPSLGR